MSTGSYNDTIASSLVSSGPLELTSDTAEHTLTLPPVCTVALLEQVRNMQELQTRNTTTTVPPSPLPTSNDTVSDEPQDEEDEADGDTDDYAEEAIPAWFTNPDFLSGNYGTPDRHLPVFREEDWVDMHEEYPQDDEGWEMKDYFSRDEEQDTKASGPSPVTSERKTVTPGGVDRYFGVKINSDEPTKHVKRPIGK